MSRLGLVLPIFALSFGCRTVVLTDTATPTSAVTATPTAGMPAPAPTATATPRSAIYTVQPGDTVASIAARFGTSVAALQAANGLTDPIIRVGQTLRIPGVEVLPTPIPTATPSGPTATPAPITPPRNLGAQPCILSAMPPLKPLPNALPLAERVRSTVWWSTLSLRNTGGSSQGTGIVVQTDARGFNILTAYHVIRDARPGQPILVGPYADWTLTASISAIKPEADLALLRVQTPSRLFEPVPLGDSNGVCLGDSIYLFSYPGSAHSNLVLSDGVAVGRYPMSGGGGLYLSTNAQASPGSSGGIAINGRGELIGIVSAGIDNPSVLRGLGYPELSLISLLVPSNEARSLVGR